MLVKKKQISRLMEKLSSAKLETIIHKCHKINTRLENFTVLCEKENIFAVLNF